MSGLKKRLSLMPLHAVVMCISAIVSLVSVFIPMFELFVQYKRQRLYSLFTLILDSQVCVTLRDSTVNLDFKVFGATMFTITTILAAAALTLALGFQLYSDNPTKKRWGCFSVLILLAARLVIHVYTLSNIVTDAVLAENHMTVQRLYVVQTLAGNILCVIIIAGIIAALYGALGLKMSMKLLSYPYILWIGVFTVLPLALILFRAFFAKTTGGYEFNMDGFKTLFADKSVTTTFYGARVTLQEYFSVFLRSLDYAVWTTIGCLVFAYPLAFILAERSKRLHKTSSKLLLLFVLPMWMNTMLRTYAWRAFFAETGVFNTIMMSAGLIKAPVMFLQNPILSDIITKLVMINDFLPFMVLPIYSVLVKIDSALSQAAEDLGANKVQTFTKVLFPLSLPGVISGIQMVFMPSMTFYMIPDIISEGSKTTIGNTVQTFILNESTTYQQAGNVLSLILLIFVLITMGLLRNSDKEASGSGGMVL
ncbi:MAG: ABC transporter permease [Saccharofermentans sp.]|nr:ABC transporter permease [Saccharofermentans sp.]